MQNFTHALLVLFFFLSSHSHGQIEAQFEADKTDGCPPLLVTFSNQSNYPPGATFHWNFGNGRTSSASQPQTTYPETGEFTVTLIVSAGAESDTLSIKNYITAYTKHLVAFTIDKAGIGCIPASFGFTNETIIHGGEPVEYTWSFGDGSISNSIAPQYTYKQKGIYDITLAVTDINGCTSSHTEEELVHVYRPEAKFGADEVYSCNGSLFTNFNNLSESVLPLTYSWKFGDGTSSQVPSPSHNYNQTGRKTVQLNIRNSVGCEDSIQVEDLIIIEKTKAAFSLSNDTICPDQNLSLTNKSEDATIYKWDFGDGSISNDVNPIKKFSEAGDYSIHLHASNGICHHDSIINVHVEKVVANFQAAETFLCQVPKIVRYYSFSENAVQWSWRFGNGEIAMAENPNVKFEETKTIRDLFYESYSDTLTVTSKHGCKHQRIIEKSVEVQIPNVRIGHDETLTGCLPKTILFSDNTQYDSDIDEITSRTWLVDGQKIDEGTTLTYTFTEPGDIPIELVVETAKQCKHSSTSMVSVGNTVTPDFTVKDGPDFCASETIYFKNTSPDRDEITSLNWKFGDGNTFPFPVNEPFHNYTDTGYMAVTLTVFNYGCGQSITKEKAVYIKGPVSLFTIENNCTAPFDYRFIGNTIDADSYTWNFGDGSTNIDNISSVDHTYSNRGDYIVTLTSENETTGCTYEISNQALVRHLKSKIESDKLLACLNDSVVFDASTSVDAVPFMHNEEKFKYLWLITSDEKEYFSDSTIAHSFKHKGLQEIKLITQDVNECRDTTVQFIRTFQPATDFKSNHKRGCMPITFNFNDLSSSDTTIVDWLWNFGDDSTANDQHPIHEYSEFGSYTVSLQVKDILGCSNKKVEKEHIKTIFPDPAFKVSDSTSCLGQNLTFQDLSESEIISFDWDFGDSNTSTLSSPTHSYADTGFYTVSLHIKDSYGCEGTGTKSDYIHIQKPPVADFKASATHSNCYPFLVQFSDLSETKYPGFWHWDFDDNYNHSNQQNPSFIYNKPDTYSVTLISSTSYGCSDTLSKTNYINVGGPHANMLVPDTACQKKDIRMIAADKQNIYDLVWDFGNGYTSTGDTVYYQYNKIEPVYPSLFIRSDANNTCNKVIRDTIEIFNLVADYSIQNNIVEGCVPLTLTYENQSINATSVLWDFSDGYTSSKIHPTHLYEKSGVFPSILIAYDNKYACTDTLSKYLIDVHPLPQVTISNDTLICRGDNYLLLAQGGQNYFWSPQKGLDDPEIPNPIAEPDSSTRYTAQVTDKNGCIDSADIWIAVQQIPSVPLRDTTLIIGESFDLNISDSGIKSYEWTPDKGLSCADCSELIIGPLETTSYNVTVTDTSDCFEIVNNFNVEVLHKFSIALPSAFTPNGDGLNDFAYVKGWGIKELIEFSIYNRFGEKIFSTSQLNQGWDGTFNGEIQPIETYSFLVKAITYHDEIIEKNGYIKILK
ncbi:MAG: PKD domain-containing protein [Marinilabiliaceae bacterium]|nr:PKD domain-containing protein [Marinilabiliaceae bacterium]